MLITNICKNCTRVLAAPYAKPLASVSMETATVKSRAVQIVSVTLFQYMVIDELMLKEYSILMNYFTNLKKEFKGYNLSSFKKDLMAGITVAAVALPLSLAFGIGSGASAHAGLITAIIAGFIIGSLAGASFQISGPTGSMLAISLALATKFGLNGLFIAGLMAGVLLIIAGILNLGKIVSVIPAPVIAGFTSGIALIIIISQVDNFFGFTDGSDSLNLWAVGISLVTIVFLFAFPKKVESVYTGILINTYTCNRGLYCFQSARSCYRRYSSVTFPRNTA